MQIFSIFTCYIRVYLVTRNRKPFFILVLLKEGNLLFYNWRKDRVVRTEQYNQRLNGVIRVLVLYLSCSRCFILKLVPLMTARQLSLASQMKFLLVYIHQESEGETPFPSMQCNFFHLD